MGFAGTRRAALPLLLGELVFGIDLSLETVEEALPSGSCASGWVRGASPR